MSILLRRRGLLGGVAESAPLYAVTRATNPEVMDICVAQGWATESNDYLTFAEAAAVTSVGQAFAGSSIVTFNEYQYFTGVSESGAFNASRSLTSITLPSQITLMTSYAFRLCSRLTEITIPASVTAINGYVFASTDGLTKVTCLATTPPTFSTKNSIPSDCVIYVPSGSVATYQSASMWSNYADRIQAISE